MANFTPSQKDYIKIGKFKFWAITNFPFIEQDFDSLTIYEIISKIVDYLNKLLENQGRLEENQQALLNAFVEIQNYMNAKFNEIEIELNNHEERIGTLESDVVDLTNIVNQHSIDIEQLKLLTPKVEELLTNVQGLLDSVVTITGDIASINLNLISLDNRVTALEQGGGGGGASVSALSFNELRLNRLFREIYLTEDKVIDACCYINEDKYARIIYTSSNVNTIQIVSLSSGEILLTKDITETNRAYSMTYNPSVTDEGVIYISFDSDTVRAYRVSDLGDYNSYVVEEGTISYSVDTSNNAVYTLTDDYNVYVDTGSGRTLLFNLNVETSIEMIVKDGLIFSIDDNNNITILDLTNKVVEQYTIEKVANGIYKTRNLFNFSIGSNGQMYLFNTGLDCLRGDYTMLQIFECNYLHSVTAIDYSLLLSNITVDPTSTSVNPTGMSRSTYFKTIGESLDAFENAVNSEKIFIANGQYPFVCFNNIKKKVLIMRGGSNVSAYGINGIEVLNSNVAIEYAQVDYNQKIRTHIKMLGGTLEGTFNLKESTAEKKIDAELSKLILHYLQYKGQDVDMMTNPVVIRLSSCEIDIVEGNCPLFTGEPHSTITKPSKLTSQEFNLQRGEIENVPTEFFTMLEHDVTFINFVGGVYKGDNVVPPAITQIPSTHSEASTVIYDINTSYNDYNSHTINTMSVTFSKALNRISASVNRKVTFTTSSPYVATANKSTTNTENLYYMLKNIYIQ